MKSIHNVLWTMSIVCALGMELTTHPIFAREWNVKKDGTGDFTTIQACANVMAAGDTCLVHPGLYDERVAIKTVGTASARVVFKAATPTKPKVRAFTLTNASYTTIHGFEITSIGMSPDLEYHGTVIISGGTGIRITDNHIHDTRFQGVGFGNTTFLTVSGNQIDHCAVARAIIGNPGGPYTITAGVNDKVKFLLNGSISYTVTLTPGTGRTAGQICADINAVAGVSAVTSTNAVNASGIGADGRIHIHPYWCGPFNSVILQDVSNNAYATLGLSLGGEVDIGHAAAVTATTAGPAYDVLVENNRLSRVSDYFLPKGQRFVLRNNIFGPSDIASTAHIDGIQANAPADFLLCEGNQSIDNTSSDNHFMHLSASCSKFIIRYNSSLRSKGGLGFGESATTSTQFAHYNNTWYNNVDYYRAWSQVVLIISTNNLSRNNIWHRSVINPGGNPYYLYPTATMDRDYDLLYQSGDAKQVHQIFSDPQFVNGSIGDFRLQSTSPARDAGGPITLATNSGTGSVTLAVKAAFAFQPGWAGVQPDWIAIGSPSNVTAISSVDYNTSTLTLASPLSWSAGDPVWLYKDSTGKQVLHGFGPDIGASEFVPVTLDSDGDGLLDSWEIQYFGSIDDPRAEPGLDVDGDGLTNLEEQSTETSPIDAASVLRIITQSLSETLGFTVTWQSVSNKSYVVQNSSNLINWTNSASVDSVSSSTSWTDPSPSGLKKFYRVKLP